MWTIERELFDKGIRIICGVDEAGAGPLAGAVYAGAVILPCELHIEGLTDSKQVSEKKRDVLYDVICDKAAAWAVASVSADEIDEINILQARMRAMNRAIAALSVEPEFALIDGTYSKGIEIAHMAVKGGDALSASIAAGSILAKVSRDRYMVEMAGLYPQYEFERHKGYPTKRHYELLRKFGPSPIHRRSFLKKL